MTLGKSNFPQNVKICILWWNFSSQFSQELEGPSHAIISLSPNLLITLPFSVSLFCYQAWGDFIHVRGAYPLALNRSWLKRVFSGYDYHIYSLHTSHCLFKYTNLYLSRKGPDVVPIHCGGVGPVTCFHNCPDWGPLAGNIECGSLSGWTLEALMLARHKVSLSQWAIVALDTSGTVSIFLVKKSLLLHCSLSFVLTKHSFASLLDRGIFPLTILILLLADRGVLYLAPNTGWRSLGLKLLSQPLELFLADFSQVASWL